MKTKPIKTITVQVGSTVEVKTHNQGFGRPSWQSLDYGYGISFDPDGSLDYMIERLLELKSEFGSEYTELHFDAQSCRSCYHDCSCRPSYILMGTRPMNQIEIDFTAAQEAAREKDRDERERAEFARLAEKFAK